ncbi:hypothetical protein [Paenibacillus sp. TY11]|uniref:hypothetical protein n=1 Tax=Paenibacillus sp. TY11 TaxID=3448633 RepID=UPI00403A0507
MINGLTPTALTRSSGTPQDFGDAEAAGTKQITYVYSLERYIGLMILLSPKIFSNFGNGGDFCIETKTQCR